ncbi:hypothetical protein ACLQ2R_05175 [Streptosporangium sp. DT93]|uniref:hypothetical protein n=1 Tax=Streptosporangium sp. DT93 TaxID=3393428 RepID=UPI003CF79FB1
MVDVEGVQDAAQVPVQLALAPDRVPEGKRGGQRRGRGEVDRVAGDGPGVVVFDDGAPGPGRVAGRGDHPQIELGVVGQPDLVEPFGLAPVHQLIQLLVAARSLLDQHGQGRVQAADDGIHGGVAGHWPVLFGGDRGDLAVDGGDAQRWTLQRQSFDQ